MNLKGNEIVRAAADLDLQQLEQLHGWVLEVISEKQQALEQRRTEKTKRELQGLLRQAGMSWEEFQNAL